MTKPEAHRFLNAVRLGLIQATSKEITAALFATGDIAPNMEHTQ